jgi:hypothetical protein
MMLLTMMVSVNKFDAVHLFVRAQGPAIVLMLLPSMSFISARATLL